MWDYPDIVHTGVSHLGLDIPFILFGIISKESAQRNDMQKKEGSSLSIITVGQ